jgi:hypothetical protein
MDLVGISLQVKYTAKLNYYHNTPERLVMEPKYLFPVKSSDEHPSAHPILQRSQSFFSLVKSIGDY